jgi:hypothetical protein
MTYTENPDLHNMQISEVTLYGPCINYKRRSSTNTVDHDKMGYSLRSGFWSSSADLFITMYA